VTIPSIDISPARNNITARFEKAWNMRKLKEFAAALVLATALAPAAVLTIPTAAFAQKTVSAKVGKPLQEAQAAAKAGDFRGALAKVKEAEAITPKTAYEEMVVQDFKVYVCSNLRDSACAAAAAEAAFKTNAWAAGEKGRRLKYLSQINYTIRNYAKCISYAERHFAEVGQSADLAELVAQAYYQQGNWTKALQLSQDAIRAAERAGQKPKKGTLQIAQASAYKLKNGAVNKDLLFKLVDYYPSADYWASLVGTLKAQTGTSDHFRLDALRLLDAAGGLKKAADYMQMGEMSLQQGLPGETLRIVNKGFAAGVLGVGPEAARQKRLQTEAGKQAAAAKAGLARKAAAASASPQGDDDIKVAEAYETFGDNQNALPLLATGLSKAGLKAPDEGRLLLGRVQLNLKKKAEAISTFKSITTDPKYSELARAWAILAKQKT